jgi:hypothetical protein
MVTHFAWIAKIKNIFTGIPLLVLGESYGRWLEMEIGLEILCNFVNKMLEAELPDEELSQFLVVVDVM